MRGWTALTLLLTTACAALAQDERAHFEEGRRLAERGMDARSNFALAAAQLEQVAKERPSPEAFLNLGKAAFLADDAPRAIWAFRRGLALAPQHRQLREHLDHARAQVALPRQHNGQPERDPWPAWLPRWSGCVWLTLTAAAYSAACAAAAVWLIGRRRAWLMTSLAALGSAAVAGYAWTVGYLECRREIETPVVVIQTDGTPLRTGNGPSYPPHPDLPSLHGGMEARRLTERGGWLQIQFACGAIGWAPRGAVVVGVNPDRP
jgi:hypothetical protein